MIERDTAQNFNHYRRFEISVNEFRFTTTPQITKMCPQDECKIYSSIKFNDLTDERSLNMKDEKPIKTDEGYFLLHRIEWDDDGNDPLNVFKKINTLTIIIKIKKIDQNDIILYQKTYQNIIRMEPDDEALIRINLLNDVNMFVSDPTPNSLSIYYSYYCNGYIGLNCEFDCYDPDGKFECDFDTGEKICKEANRFNPPACTDKIIRECTPEENKCKNNGICRIKFEEQITCECVVSFYGKYCEVKNCDFCNPINGRCINGECVCTNKNTRGKYCNETVCDQENSNCVNGGICKVIQEELICICDPKRYTGLKCEKECNPLCHKGECVSLNGITFCHCERGISGDDCQIENKNFLAEKAGFVHSDDQWKTFKWLFIVMSIISVGTILHGMYLSKLKNNLK